MRLLINILNEYESYLEQLQTINLDKNKLFAMVVYKNYYPNDFAKLNSNNGEIYNIFYKEKLEIIESFIKDKERILVDLKSREVEIKSERVNSIDELNSIYAYKILSKLDTMQWIRSSYELNIEIKVNSNIYSAKDISNTEVLTELSQYQNLTFEITSTSFSKDFRFSDIEDEVDSSSSYLERLASIEDKENGELERLLNEESNTRNQIQYTRRMMLRELLTQNYTITDKPLLKFFIINGHIDETYQSYISYFFEESISLNDKNYALLVNSFDKPDFELELKKCSELIETYLGLDNLSNHSALNFSMLDFLLTDASKKVYLEQYINVVCDGSSISTDFLKRYFRREKNLSLLIPKIVDLREIIIDDMDISSGTKEALFNFKNFIKYIPFNRYQELPYLKEEFRRDLSSTGNYVEFILECFDGDFDRFKAFTDAVHPTLECATFSPEQVKELNWLGENSYLAINKHMIDQVLINNSDKPEDIIANLEVKPVTLMANSGIDYLIENIWSENISEYIRIILLGADEHTLYSEDEDVYIKALNVFGSRNSIIERFIDITSTKIKDISKIENEQIRKYLVANSKVYYSWSNVFRYFSESYEDQDDQGVYREIDAALIKFLEDGKSDLQATDYIELDVLENEDWQSIKAEFDRHLFLSYQLSNEAYNKVIGITDNNWDNSDLEGISQEKIQTLISLEKLSLTPENWEQIKEHASKEVILAFLVKNIESIMNDLDFIQLRPQDIVSLLFSKDINNNSKRFLVENIGFDLISVGEHIRKKILGVYDSDRIPITIYEQLMEHAGSNELKKLLLNQIDNMNDSEIMRVLSLLDEPYQTLINGTDVEFEDSEENRAILNKLNIARIVRKFPKPKRPKGSPMGKKVLTTRLQSHVLGN